MTTQEEMNKDLKNKLYLLELTVAETESILEEGNQEELERQLKDIKAYCQECQVVKRNIELFNVTNKELDEEELKAFSQNVRAKLRKADEACKNIVEWFADVKKKKLETERKEKLQFEMELQQLQLEGIQKKHEMKLKLAHEEAIEEGKAKETSKADDNKDKMNGMASMSKLPRINIDQYYGSALDWQRFSSQFEENIDKQNMAATNKLSYLMGYLAPNVKQSILGLPYSKEGYEAAKEILNKQYGKPSAVINAYVKEITELPHITGNNYQKIHEFYLKLNHAVNALQTLSKLERVEGNVIQTLNKLPGIKGDLVRNDKEWEEWGFVKLLEELEAWTTRNKSVSQPDPTPPDPHKRYERENKRVYTATVKEERTGECVYCDDPNHKAQECPNVTQPRERLQVLLRKRLCFNCTYANHRIWNCPSKKTCYHCGDKHHTSICDKATTTDTENKSLLFCTKTDKGTFPMVVARVNGVLCRAVLDTASDSNYVSTQLVNKLNVKPVNIRSARIDMMLAKEEVRMETYQVEISSVDKDFKFVTEVDRVHGKGPLLYQPNPRYAEMIEKYEHLKGVYVHDKGTQPELNVHMVLGVDVFTNLKRHVTRHGAKGEPVAELTELGWTIVKPTKAIKFERVTRNDDRSVLESQAAKQMTERKVTQERMTKQPPVQPSSMKPSTELPGRDIATVLTDNTPLPEGGGNNEPPKLCDPPGFASPLTEQVKKMYKALSQVNEVWESEMPTTLQIPCSDGEGALSLEIKLPQSLLKPEESLQDVKLHAFGAASKEGEGAAVYVAVKQDSGTTINLVAAKSRLYKNVTDEPLELSGAQMAAELLKDVRTALPNLPVSSTHGWTSSPTVLSWLNGKGQLRQFVMSKVENLLKHCDIQWHCVTANENPAYLASKGGGAADKAFCLKGPPWLAEKSDWPASESRMSPVNEKRLMLATSRASFKEYEKRIQQNGSLL